MTQTIFNGNTTPSEASLDLNFTQLYDLREYVTTPGYAAATPKAYFDASFNFGVGQNPSAVVYGTTSTIQASALSAAAVIAAFHVDGTNNVRVGMFADSSTRLVGWDIGYSTTTNGYAWRSNNVEFMRATTAAMLLGRTAQQSGGRLEVAGNIVANLPAAAPTLGVNSDMSFQLVSNTSLKILVRGSDGVTRSTSLTLA
jgi:hypothetical protein